MIIIIIHILPSADRQLCEVMSCQMSCHVKIFSATKANAFKILAENCSVPVCDGCSCLTTLTYGQ